MFTTLNLDLKERTTLKEKLHLTPTRKFSSYEHEYNKVKFYTTRLISYSPKNDLHLYKFKQNCILPVIENNDDLVLKYRYVLTLNTVMKYDKTTQPNYAVVDPDARLLHLLPTLVSRCRKVNIYTAATEKYADENERIFSLIGGSAIIAEECLSLKSFDAVFADIPLPFCDNPRLFGRYSHFARGVPILPDDFNALPLATDEIYPVLAALYYIGGVKKLGRLHCNTLQKPTNCTA